MEKKLSNNLGLKILSVFLAFFVWLAVMNIANPKVTRTKDVPLEILNEAILESSGKTYEVIGDRDTVTVSYKVSTLDAGNIKPSDFRAYIDLADVYEPTGAVPVQLEVKNNNGLLESVVPKPSVIRIETEDLQRKPFNLEVRTEGKAEDGYNPGVASVSPTYIYVSGPVSMVGRISSAGIVINIEGANSDLAGTLPVRCFDANGNDLTDQVKERVTFSRSEVDYTLPILKEKNLNLTFETEGAVADGYRFTGIESSRNSVEVKGLKSDLARANSVTIPRSELNMEGASGDLEVVIDLNKYLPEGVELADPADNEIRVTIKVEALEHMSYEVPVSQIRLVGTDSRYEYEYGGKSTQVVIEGLREDLDQLTAAAIQAELDVSGMAPGENLGTAAFLLGDAYELVSGGGVQVTVTEKEPPSTQAETEGEEESRPGPGESTDPDQNPDGE